jgi:hypothetical protein
MAGHCPVSELSGGMFYNLEASKVVSTGLTLQQPQQ